MRARPASRQTVLAVLLTVVWWASSPIGIHAALSSYSPDHVALLRFSVASLVVVPLAVWTRLRRIRSADIPIFGLLGMLGVTVHHLALNFGQQGVSPAAASVLAQSSPLFTAIISAVILRRRSSVGTWLGIGLGLGGAVLVILGEGRGWTVAPMGLLVLVAAASWAVYFLVQKPLLARYRPTDIACYSVWIGTIPLLLFSDGVIPAVVAASSVSNLAIVYLGIFPSALAYFTWAMVLREMPVVQAASFLYLAPPLAALMAIGFFGLVPSSLGILGGVVTIAAVAIVQLASPPAAVAVVAAAGPDEAPFRCQEAAHEEG